MRINYYQSFVVLFRCKILSATSLTINQNLLEASWWLIGNAFYLMLNCKVWMIEGLTLVCWELIDNWEDPSERKIFFYSGQNDLFCSKIFLQYVSPCYPVFAQRFFYMVKKKFHFSLKNVIETLWMKYWHFFYLKCNFMILKEVFFSFFFLIVFIALMSKNIKIAFEEEQAKNYTFMWFFFINIAKKRQDCWKKKMVYAFDFFDNVLINFKIFLTYFSNYWLIFKRLFNSFHFFRDGF